MSEPEFRRLSPDHHVAFRRIVDHAFSPEGGPREYDGPAATPDGPGERFGLLADGDLRSVCRHHEFTVSLRGEWVPLAGLASLATPPEYRRQGHVRRVIDGSLRAWRGECVLAALWPFDYGYYEQFGWATGCELVEYTCPPGAFAFGRDAPGTVRRVDPDDWERLQGVVEARRSERELAVRRDEEWWRQRVFRTAGGDERYVYALERDGDVRGYAAYTVESGDDGRRMRVVYNAHADLDAYRGLLGLLSNHDSQVETVTLYRPAGDPLLDLAPDPKAVECQVHPGTMVRVVDVVDALEAIPYPEGPAGTLSLAVEDDAADWNDGRFELSVSDGRGECRRVEGGDPEVRLDVGTLAQVLVGYHSVDEARELAGLSVASEDAATRLSAWLPPRRVGPLDDF